VPAAFAELFADFTDFAGFWDFWDFSDFLDFTFDFIWLRLVFFPDLPGAAREVLSRWLKVRIAICRRRQF
jgi:hypothetical protein